MKNLVLVRIDDRLIHGQVVTSWIKSTDGNRILVIDDALIHDRMMKRILVAAAPPGIQLDVMSIADAAVEIQKEGCKNERMILLVKNPMVLEKLMDQGVELKKIILGGMGLIAGRKRFNKNVAASDEEVECMRRIIEKGCEMYYQLVPEKNAVNVRTLL